MFFRYSFSRIINNRTKLLYILALFAIMLIDLVSRIQYFSRGGIPYRADDNTFLAATSTSFTAHSIVLWLLPIHLVYLTSDDIFDDFLYGYNNILLTKISKSSYIKKCIIRGFVFSFSLIFLMLIFNYICSHILFFGVERSLYGTLALSFGEGHLMAVSYKHPTAANLIFILVTAFLSGIVGASGAGLALSIHNRKLVYPMAFFIWFVFNSLPKSIMLSLQPFTEYDTNQITGTYILAVCTYALITLFCYIKERKYAEI